MGIHKFGTSVRFNSLELGFHSLSVFVNMIILSVRHHDELGLVHGSVDTNDICIQVPPVLLLVNPIGRFASKGKQP